MTAAATQLEIAAQWLEEAAHALVLLGKEEHELGRECARVVKECLAVAGKAN